MSQEDELIWRARLAGGNNCDVPNSAAHLWGSRLRCLVEIRSRQVLVLFLQVLVLFLDMKANTTTLGINLRHPVQCTKLSLPFIIPLQHVQPALQALESGLYAARVMIVDWASSSGYRMVGKPPQPPPPPPPSSAVRPMSGIVVNHAPPAADIAIRGRILYRKHPATTSKRISYGRIPLVVIPSQEEENQFLSPTSCGKFGK